MAIFRKNRRQRAMAPADADGTAAPTKPGPVLGERLREIAQAAAAPEEALEPALRAVLETTGAEAGALCLFDPRHNLLRLASEVGFSDEGCRALRSVRRGDPSSWDMPLHGLLNRRAYLIESANRNRYVPRLVERIAAVRTVACIPVYAGVNPVGSLILIAMLPRSFGERDVRALQRPLRELARMIDATRRQAAPTEAPRPSPSRADRPELVAERDHLLDDAAAGLAERARLTAEMATRGGEADRLRAALDAAGAERARLSTELERARREAERVEALTASLAAEERERARLAAALEAAASDQAQQARGRAAIERARTDAEHAAEVARAEAEAIRREASARVAAAETQVGERTAVIQRLEARIENLEASALDAGRRAREAEEESKRLAGELHTTTARETLLRQQLAAETARVSGAAAADVREAIAVTRASEEARATVTSELADARAALASAEAVVAALEAEAESGLTARERLAAAERDAATERDQLAAALADVHQQGEQTTARLAAAEHELALLRDQRDRASGALRERESAAGAFSARVETFAAENDRLREALAAATAERERVLADRVAAAFAQARLEESLARETAERARLAQALGATQAAVDALETMRVRREADAVERASDVAAELEELRAERDRLLAERDAEPAGRGERATPAPAPEPVEIVTVAPAGGPRSRVREIDPGRERIVVIDADQAWEDATVADHQTVAIPPGDDIVERVTALAPRRLVVNLAAPGAIDAILALRAAGSRLRVWGCVASPPGDRALSLGMIEAAAQPLDADAVLAVLTPHVTKGSRVVTAGGDVDALMSLRQALTREGMSVSMAWDGKQAADLLSVVRPDVVVVDLALPRRDGYAIVAALGAAEAIPVTVLIAGPDDVAQNFAATLEDPTHVGRAVPLDRLLTAIVDRSESAPQRRVQHPKVRAVAAAPRRAC